MSLTPLPEEPNKLLEYLKYVTAIVIFVFSLGVGYQRLENRVDAADAATNARIIAHVTTAEQDREYIIKDLTEIKNKLSEIERYLREKK